MDVQVVPAVPGDAEALAAMRCAFRAETGVPTEPRDAFVARCAAWMKPRLAPGGAWRAWLAIADGSQAGSLWLQLIEKIPNPGPELERHAYITSVYVDPACRGRGIGQALLDAALACCRQAEVDSVILWPSARSRTLYGRNGFLPPGDMLELVLDGARLVSGEVAP